MFLSSNLKRQKCFRAVKTHGGFFLLELAKQMLCFPLAVWFDLFPFGVPYCVSYFCLLKISSDGL